MARARVEVGKPRIPGVDPYLRQPCNIVPEVAGQDYRVLYKRANNEIVKCDDKRAAAVKHVDTIVKEYGSRR